MRCSAAITAFFLLFALIVRVFFSNDVDTFQLPTSTAWATCYSTPRYSISSLISVQADVFRQVETVCPPSRILLADADFNDFHSVLGFSLGPVRCVTDDFQGFSLRPFVRDRACFCLRIQNNKILRGPCFRNRRCHRKSRYAGSNRNHFHMIFIGTLFKLHGTRSTCAMSLWLTELASPSSQAMVTSLQDVPITVPRSVVVVPQQTRSPTLSVLDWSPVI